MSAEAPISERGQLEEFDRYLEQFIVAVREEAAGQIDAEQIERLVKTTKRLAMRLNESLPPMLDIGAVAEVRDILLGGVRKLDEFEDRPIDLLDDFLLRAESIRHIVRDALDEDLTAEVDLENKAAFSRWLLAELGGPTRRDAARLLGIDVRTFQRWLGGTGGRSVSYRTRLIAQLIAILKNAWTPEGVAAWFDRVRPDLDGAAPIDLLDDPSRDEELLAAARRGRAQHGS